LTTSGRPLRLPSGFNSHLSTVISFSASTPDGALQCGLSWRFIACARLACSAGPNVAAGVPPLRLVPTPSRKSSPSRVPPACRLGRADGCAGRLGGRFRLRRKHRSGCRGRLRCRIRCRRFEAHLVREAHRHPLRDRQRRGIVAHLPHQRGDKRDVRRGGDAEAETLFAREVGERSHRRSRYGASTEPWVTSEMLLHPERLSSPITAMTRPWSSARSARSVISGAPAPPQLTALSALAKAPVSTCVS